MCLHVYIISLAQLFLTLGTFFVGLHEVFLFRVESQPHL